MIYRYLLLLLGSLYGAAAVAQAFPIKLYEYPSDERQGLFELAQLPNGNVLMFGHHFATSTVPDRAGVLMTLNTQGEHVAPPLKVGVVPAQIKDVLVRPDGSMVLLTKYQDQADLSTWFGLIWRDADGQISRSRSWAGDARAITWANNGDIFVVGNQRGARGMFAYVTAGGTLRSIQQVLPETRRPAGIIDAVTLRDGTIFAYGSITTSIAGVAQAEIITYRFSGEGVALSAAKISRGAFFERDGLAMFIRSPARIQLDAEERVYLSTYMGAGGDGWRTHLMRLTVNGNVTRSHTYRHTNQVAGQGGLHVSSSGISTFAYETITKQVTTDRSLTVLQVGVTGAKIKSTRRRGRVFDVTSLLPAAGGFIITGTTLACDSDERTTYLAHLTDDYRFLDDPCSEADLSMRIDQLGVESGLAVDLEFEPLPIIIQSAPTLVPADVSITEAECLTSDASEVLSSFDTTVVLCPGESYTYTPELSARTQVQWKDGRSSVPRTWGWSEPGTYELELDNGCSNVMHTVTVKSRTDLTDLGQTLFLNRCGANGPVELSMPLRDGDELVWQDGSTENPRLVTESGTYGATVSNECGAQTLLMIVGEANLQDLKDNRETIILCHGDSILYTPELRTGVTGVWADQPTDTASAVWLSRPGTYVLERTNGCSSATTELIVENEDCCTMYLPTAFSPNGDGVNETYRPLLAADGCAGVDDIWMEVFNRWGGQVFEGAGTAWDGTLPGGQPAEVGSYLMVLRYWNGVRVVTRSSDVLLMR